MDSAPDPGAAPLAQAVRAYRLRAGLTQSDAAARAGIGVRTLREIERGMMLRPHPRTVAQLARGLGLDAAPRQELLALAGRARAAEPVAVDVLGPLCLWRHGNPVRIGSPKVRRLLGLLAIQAGRTAGIDEVVDALWDTPPPRTYRALIHEYAAKLREAIGAPSAAAVLTSVPGGYQLELGTAQLDALRFDDLRAQGQRARDRGEHRRALQLFDESLRCWRGPVLAGIGGHLAHHPATVALSVQRLSTATAMGDAALECGDYPLATEQLAALARAEPLDEALHARLMLVLAGAGHEAAAVRLYAELRTRLAEELGLDPGPQLQAAYRRLVRRELHPAPTAGARPAQLPAGVIDFTGRDAELDQLAEVSQAGQSPGLPVIVLSGAPGIGKTALAVHWGHSVADRFPDGQLFVDLHGYSTEPPVRPLDALRQLLIACGVPAGQVPVELPVAVGAYRTQLHGRRMLVLLDNAASAEQVLPLLPGGGASLVVVTSRDRLAGLATAASARLVTVDVLPPPDAVGMVGRIVGPARVAAEPAAALDLVELCGRLPLAIRVAAADLAGGRGRLADYVSGLRAEGSITGLAVGGDRSAAVAAAFDLSYTQLSPRQRRLFRLLGVAPGEDFGPDAAALLLASSVPEARALLDDLARSHLIERADRDRFRLHDLLRGYAADRALAEDSAEDRDRAVLAMVWGQTGRASVASRMLYPHVQHLPDGPHAAAEVAAFPDRAAALRWFDTERANLLSAVRLAAARSWPVAGHLAGALRGYLEHRWDIDNWLDVARAGIKAAVAAGDDRVAIAGRMSLAVAYACLADFAHAKEGFEAALVVARTHGWGDVEAVAVANLAMFYQQTGEVGRAIPMFEAALSLYRDSGWLAGQGTLLANLGSAYFARGQLAESVAYYQEAVRVADDAGARVAGARALEHLARSNLALGSIGPAGDQLARALEYYREVGDRRGEMSALALLAQVYVDRGDPEKGRQLADSALSLGAAEDRDSPPVDAFGALSRAAGRTGELTAARWYAARAVRAAVTTGRPYLQAQTRLELAEAQYALGRSDQAARSGTRALELAQGCGYRALAGQAERLLAAVAGGTESAGSG